jgi:hypothetical protein
MSIEKNQTTGLVSLKYGKNAIFSSIRGLANDFQLSCAAREYVASRGKTPYMTDTLLVKKDIPF